METMIQNSSKQMLICGTHTIWMMEIENWVISLKTHPTQTSSYFLKYDPSLALSLLSIGFLWSIQEGERGIKSSRGIYLFYIRICIYLIHEIWLH